VELTKGIKMYKKFYLGVIFSIASLNINAQSNNEYIDSLYSDNLDIQLDAIWIIIEDGISEALPVLQSLYDSRTPMIKEDYLIAMMQFDDPDIHQRLLDFITASDTFNSVRDGISPLEAKLEATKYLISLGDYSTYHYIFQAVNKANWTTIMDVPVILTHIPFETAKDSARAILLDYWDTGTNPYARSFIISQLVETDGAIYTDRLVSTFQNDPDRDIGRYGFRYLMQLKYPEMESLLQSQLITESSAVIRIEIADTLLKVFGNPFNVKLIKDYQPTEPDTTAKSLMNFSLLEFIPPKPDSTVTALVMTDTLISYNNQLYNYQWITSDSLYNNYAVGLQTIRDFIASSDYTSAQTEIDSMQTSVEENYNSPSPLLTREGWKFLHYYLEYIEERINN